MLIETAEVGLYNTFELENVDVIAQIGYEAAMKAFDKVLEDNKYETLVKMISSNRRKALQA